MTHSHPDACSFCLNIAPRGPQETGTVQLPVNHDDNVHIGHTDLMSQRVRKKTPKTTLYSLSTNKTTGWSFIFQKGKISPCSFQLIHIWSGNSK